MVYTIAALKQRAGLAVPLFAVLAALVLRAWEPKRRLPLERLLLINVALLLVVWVGRAAFGVLPPV